MKIKVLTIFPDMLRPVISSSILGRATDAGLLDVELIDIRPYSENKHKNTDDYPFGGGAGMVMLAQPIVDCMEDCTRGAANRRRIYLSPKGRVLTQSMVENLAECDELVLLCGHYEGVDQRAIDLVIDEEISIGDYVLTGGEMAALVLIDAVARMVPGVLGSKDSAQDESFSSGLLEYPHYTRPRSYRGLDVPDVLVGGDHKKIDRWRRDEALRITRTRRPELLQCVPLDRQDHALLARLNEADGGDLHDSDA